MFEFLSEFELRISTFKRSLADCPHVYSIGNYSEAAMQTIETLERRVLLDGDVAASFSNGDLTLRADDGDNHVRIEQPRDGTVRVVGLDDTTINGDDSVEFSGGLNDVRIRTRQGGEDTVEIQGPVRIGGDVNARLGEGEFIIEGTLGAVEIAGSVVTHLGSESDVQFRNDVTVSGRTIGVGSAVTAAATPAVVPEFDAANFSDPLDIDNPYFPLVPGTVYTYEERSVDDETGETEVEVVTIEVTNDTKTIQGVETRVVRARETRNGRLVEDTFDWHAQDDDGNVWYFGEDTTSFRYDEQGNLVEQSTAGSFQAGTGGARAGVVMLARPQVGDAYFQEVLVGEAIDVGEVLATNETLTTDLLGTSRNVLRTRDSTALEPDALEEKLYVPGFGLAAEIKFDLVTGEQDGEVRLVSATRDGQPVTEVVPPDGFQGQNVTGAQRGPVRFGHNVSFTSEGDSISRNARFGRAVFMTSPADVVVLDSTLADGAAVVSGGSIGLRGLEVGGGKTWVRAAEEVVVNDSAFEQTLFVRFAGGDNTLAVGGSSIGVLNADGGRGEDIFEDLGDNEIDASVLKRFEMTES
jgi:hypothetical protein